MYRKRSNLYGIYFQEIQDITALYYYLETKDNLF